MCTCWFCGAVMHWSGDFDFEDYGMEGSGVVANLTCSGCEATAEFYSKPEEEEEEVVTKHMILNPNFKVVTAIKKRLAVTGGYCPCLPERTEDTVCPCKDFRTEQICHCSLYVEEGGKY